MTKYLIVARDKWGVKFMDSEYGIKKAKNLLCVVRLSYPDCTVTMRKS